MQKLELLLLEVWSGLSEACVLMLVQADAEGCSTVSLLPAGLSWLCCDAVSAVNLL